MGIDALVFFQLLEVDPVVVVLVVCLFDEGLGLLLVFAEDLFFGGLIRGLDKADEQVFESLAHWEDKTSREQRQLFSVFDYMQVLKFVLVSDQMLNVRDHVHPTIMSVGLAG